MNEQRLIQVLNRLLTIHARSLPMYLGFAAPWTRRGRQQEIEVIEQIAADQQQLAERAADLVLENSGSIEDGEFPLVYTAYHDLSLDFLLQKLVEHQQVDIQQIQDCVDQLEEAPVARALAEEALGAAKGHLDSLRELQAQYSQVS